MPSHIHPSILTHFASIEDPRQSARVLYPLTEIPLLALAATIAGADDFVEVTLWGEQHQSFLRRFFPYEHGIPSHDRAKGRKPLHMVSARASGQRIVLGQQACEEKSNEITAIPLLLKTLDLTGTLVTIDAMGTQTKIAQAILDGGGDYVRSLKENWPATYAGVVLLFNSPPRNTLFDMSRIVVGCNGRIATRVTRCVMRSAG